MVCICFYLLQLFCKCCRYDYIILIMIARFWYKIFLFVILLFILCIANEKLSNWFRWITLNERKKSKWNFSICSCQEARLDGIWKHNTLKSSINYVMEHWRLNQIDLIMVKWREFSFFFFFRLLWINQLTKRNLIIWLSVCGEVSLKIIYKKKKIR